MKWGNIMSLPQIDRLNDMICSYESELRYAERECDAARINFDNVKSTDYSMSDYWKAENELIACKNKYQEYFLRIQDCKREISGYEKYL